MLTSSAATEDALESKEIRGSFFTNNLVSGLRGAADASGDGHITLGEAYRYAYAGTVASTVDTVVGAQHPGYAYQLSGMGEIVLTELATASAALLLPAGSSARWSPSHPQRGPRRVPGRCPATSGARPR